MREQWGNTLVVQEDPASGLGEGGRWSFTRDFVGRLPTGWLFNVLLSSGQRQPCQNMFKAQFELNEWQYDLSVVTSVDYSAGIWLRNCTGWESPGRHFASQSRAIIVPNKDDSGWKKAFEQSYEPAIRVSASQIEVLTRVQAGACRCLGYIFGKWRWDYA